MTLYQALARHLTGENKPFYDSNGIFMTKSGAKNIKNGKCSFYHWHLRQQQTSASMPHTLWHRPRPPRHRTLHLLDAAARAKEVVSSGCRMFRSVSTEPVAGSTRFCSSTFMRSVRTLETLSGAELGSGAACTAHMASIAAIRIRRICIVVRVPRVNEILVILMLLI